MSLNLSVNDMLTLHETDDEDEGGYPVVAVKFLGIEVERGPMYMWGSDKGYQDFDRCAEKAAKMIRLMWTMANGDSDD